MKAWYRGSGEFFLSALRPAVGANPIECNSDLRRRVVVRLNKATPAQLAEWFACASSARAARRPFLIVVEQPPFEGWFLNGIAGLPDGSIRAFSYYEGCCWPPSPELKAGACEAPAAQTRSTGTYGIRCANERKDRYFAGSVPTPEYWLRAAPLPEDLIRHLVTVTGEAPVDCGLDFFPSPRPSPKPAGELEAALGCASLARANGRSFFVMVQQMSRQSIVLQGLAGTANGELQEIAYEISPCSGPGCAPEARFDVRPCPRPRIVERRRDYGDYAEFVCQAVTTRSAPLTRRRPGP